MEILGRARKSPQISENFGNTSNPFLRKLKRLMKHMENFGNSSKVFSRCFYDFLKLSENLWKSSDRKCSYQTLAHSCVWFSKNKEQDTGFCLGVGIQHVLIVRFLFEFRTKVNPIYSRQNSWQLFERQFSLSHPPVALNRGRIMDDNLHSPSPSC